MGRHQKAFAKAKKDAEEANAKKEAKAKVWIQGPQDRDNKWQVLIIFLCIRFLFVSVMFSLGSMFFLRFFDVERLSLAASLRDNSAHPAMPPKGAMTFPNTSNPSMCLNLSKHTKSIYVFESKSLSCTDPPLASLWPLLTRWSHADLVVICFNLTMVLYMTSYILAYMSMTSGRHVMVCLKQILRIRKNSESSQRISISS